MANERKQKSGDDGHGSHYLSHAKRPLYHLSYIPYMYYHLVFNTIINTLLIMLYCCCYDGHRSHYLSHAKRPLYHLSYIPIHKKIPTILKY
ncbi:unnamed protein product, partial [Laminaria digitata]